MNGRRWALGILLLLAACGRPPGEPASDFTVPTLDGGAFTLSHALAQGKPVVVFFMAYWCAACLPEAQALGRLRQAYGDRLKIVAIDVDPTRTPEALKAFTVLEGAMDRTLAVYALVTGGITAFNPCGMAMLPAYLGYVLAETASEGRPSVGEGRWQWDAWAFSSGWPSSWPSGCEPSPDGRRFWGWGSGWG